MTIGYKLGDGTSGKVFIATTNTTGKSYALKQIKVKMMTVASHIPRKKDCNPEEDDVGPITKPRRKKKLVMQKDYLREPYINKLLMIGPQMWHPNIV